MGLVAEVLDVAQASSLAGLDGCHLDRPLAGTQPEAGLVSVSGWALGQGSPVVAIEIDHAGATVAREASLFERRDVAAAFPGHPGADRAGFELTVAGVWGEPVELTVSAQFSDRSRCQVGSITVRGGSHDANAPLVSVVIPCYGQAHFLPDALISVLSQTYSNVEVIVVDDGSHDNVAAVVARYPGVRYIRQNNRGLSGARNTGLRESTGEFLVFLDADDMLLPVALQAGIACFERHPDCGFVIGRYRYVNRPGARPHSISELAASEDPYRSLLRDNYIAMFATCMFRRLALDEVGEFDETLHAAEDYDLYLRIARNYPIQAHDAVVVDYRRGGHNVTYDGRLMLVGALSVVRRQRRYAFKRDDLRTAYAEGLRFWRGFYGPMAIEQVGDAVAAHDWSRSLRGLVTLVRHYPTGLRDLVREGADRQTHRRGGS